MKISELLETATAGSTSAANVSLGVFYPNKSGKQPKKKKDGTAPNALDVKGVSLFGHSTIKR